MSRPFKPRRVCQQPPCSHFKPAGRCAESSVRMSLDEFESIRLIDYLELTQEECADSMNVSRATAQAIYAGARKKLAECLVSGRELIIQGGKYELCTGAPNECTCPHCRNINKFNSRRTHDMRIAVTYENGEIFQHFGHTSQFKLYDIENGEIKSSSIADTNGSGHGALAGLLSTLKADILICGGIGGGARSALAQAGIQLYSGAAGSADEAVAALLQNKLTYDPNFVCNHHGHNHGEHDCGSHHCK